MQVIRRVNDARPVYANSSFIKYQFSALTTLSHQPDGSNDTAARQFDAVQAKTQTCTWGTHINLTRQACLGLHIHAHLYQWGVAAVQVGSKTSNIQADAPPNGNHGILSPVYMHD